MNKDDISVAILFAARKTAYRALPNVEIYDVERDARNFVGGMPVVAHPPCRLWTRWQGAAPICDAATRDAELQYPWLALRWVLECGGVLEHPAGSRFWRAAKLPQPGMLLSTQCGFSLEIRQGDFGFWTTKPTWLFVYGITPNELPPMPTVERQELRRDWSSLSRRQRAATPPALAEWLVEIARRCGRRIKGRRC